MGLLVFDILSASPREQGSIWSLQGAVKGVK